MQVKDIMTTSVKTVTPAIPLIEIVSLMCLYRYSGLPVMENGKLVGIIAEKDILARLLPDVDAMMGGMASIDFNTLMKDYTGLIRLLHVADLMTTGVASVPPDMHILKAAALMASKRFRRIPVADGNRLVGMVSLGDVHKAIFHESISSNLYAA